MRREVPSVPEDLRQQFISEIIDKYLAHCPADGNGVIHIGMVRLEVEAQVPIIGAGKV